MKKISASTAQTLGEWGYLAIAKHIKKIQKHETGVLADRDPEELHQIRIGMRRLRSALDGFATALILPETIQRRKIAKIARKLGELRDLDVLQAALQKNYYPQLPEAEQIVFNKVLKKLAKQRKKAFKLVTNTLKGKEYQRLITGLESWLEQPVLTKTANIKIGHILPDLLLPQMSNLLLHPGWLVGTKITAGEIEFSPQPESETVEEILVTDDESLHDLRKLAKQTRYQLELFTQLYDEEYQETVKQVKGIQSTLGELQDSFVMEKVLSQILGSALEEKLPTFVQILRKYRQKKWQQWRELQNYFLSQEIRQKLRLNLQFLPTDGSESNAKEIQANQSVEMLNEA